MMVDLKVDNKTLDVDLGGTFFASIYDFLIPIFEQKIRGSIERSVEIALKKNIGDYINNQMKEENGFIKLWPQHSLYKDLTLDYALEETIDIEDNFI